MVPVLLILLIHCMFIVFLAFDAEYTSLSLNHSLCPRFVNLMHNVKVVVVAPAIGDWGGYPLLPRLL